MNPADDNSSASASETLHWGRDVGERDLTGKSLGDFHVQRLLGRGGMGEVYLALQVSLNRQVALKVLRPDLLKRPSYLVRFEAEATAVAKLNHPNIVHVYTLGEVDGVRFLAMEYVQGTNLREYIKKKGALDYPLALSIMKQAGMAVGAAGEIGLVHRDIKPENLLLTRKGLVKVADFGLCRDLDAQGVTVTQPGVTMGTPLYMSPEQAQGQALDHRSDLYSLGVTFYHMIAGVPPFKADHALALAMKHVKNTPASLTVHRPDIPPALDRIVLKLMAKSPDDRFQSAAEMLRDLSKIRESMTASLAMQSLAEPPTSNVSELNALPATTRATDSTKKSVPEIIVPTVGLARTEPHVTRFGPKLKAALVITGLLLGCGLGWSARPVDLLAAGAPEPNGAPALWLSPDWRSVAKLGSAEQQYRDAQLRAPGEGLEAAWLAVPGHFPNSRDWASRAYTQLARLLLRRRDAEQLESLAVALETRDRAESREQDLAAVARAGVKALRGDLGGLLNDFEAKVKPTRMTDTALIDLALEVTLQADRVASRPGAPTNPALVRQQLRDIQRELTPRLLLTELRDPLLGRPRPGRPEPPFGTGSAAEKSDRNRP